MGGNDVIGHVKSFPRTFRRGAVHSFAAAQRRQCTLVASPKLPSYDDRQPQGKEPKLSDLGVTRRNPDTVRDSAALGRPPRALFPAGGTGLTTPGGHGPFGAGALRACPFPVP